jgi:thiamine biosynthesis lipoprotein
LKHLLLGAVVLALGGCAIVEPREPPVLHGETMGSEWTVRIAGPSKAALPVAALRAGVQAQFDAVDQALSTWRPDSALSRFNENDSGDWMDIDPELAIVMSYGLSLAEDSDGTYDLTVGPLVNLWGFGPEPRRTVTPDAAAIEGARARVGWRRVEVDVAGRRARKAPGVRVDLSSLGKGRGVDRVAEYLDAQGVANYLIDLSGKLRAHGASSAGRPWRVAVEQPAADDPSGAPRTVPAVVELHDASIATSGDYRKYFETGGQHYSHIIDPRTGWPVSHGTLSATAIAKTCMAADALATMFMVMPPDPGRRLADARGTPVLWISRADGQFRLEHSDSWPRR